MRIGIDARFLSHPQRGGFKTYTNNLLLAMSEIDDTNQYFVYLDRPLGDGFFSQKKNWHYKVVNGSFPILGMPLREQILLRKQVTDDQIDVVHFLCNTATVNLNKKYVVTLHDTIQVATKNEFKFKRSLAAHKQWVIAAYSKWAINNSVRSADAIVTVSNYEKVQISNQFNIPSNQITAVHLAPNPIFRPATDSQKSAWRSDLFREIGVCEKFILGLGYEPRKNIELLIDAYSRIAPKIEDLGLVIVCAEESRRLYFRRLVDELGLSEKVFLLGSLPVEMLVILYNLAEIFVYPSERESFGLPPLEAISCGVPTIAMNISSIPEILGDGALLIDGKDAQTWADVILRTISDRSVKLQLIRRGLNRASVFSWRRCAEETIQAYNDAIQGVDKN